MASPRILQVLAISALLATPAQALEWLDQREVGAGYLPPIAADYRAKIINWGTGFFANRNALAGASASSPALVRDETGRLLWLVCVEAPNAGIDPNTGLVQRHAFGFAPGYFSAPQGRVKATLTRQDCDERPLAWQPLHVSARTARRRH